MLNEYKAYLLDEITQVEAAMGMEAAIKSGVTKIAVQVYSKDNPMVQVEFTPGGDLSGLLAIIAGNVQRMRNRFAGALEYFREK